jgi:3-oxoadipate CoA-transferase alpha subunit
VIDKRVGDVAEALAGVTSGATILVGGFGEAGIPWTLLDGIRELDLTDLTLVANNAGSGETGVAALIRERRVRKIICSYPRSAGWHHFQNAWRERAIELEVVPQGTLSERIRAAAAGLGGFYTPVDVDRARLDGREVREIGGRLHVFEVPLPGDVALISAHAADRWGNLVYRLTARNFGPVMAGAAALSIVEVDRVVELGELSPEEIVTPGPLVDRVLHVGEAA